MSSGVTENGLGVPELPLLDDSWSWEAWAAAQVKVDPLKIPNTPREVTMMVHRGEAVGITAHKMSRLLQIPLKEIRSMISSPRFSDPYREEAASLLSSLRVDAFDYERCGTPFSKDHATHKSRFEHVYFMIYSQIEGATQVARSKT